MKKPELLAPGGSFLAAYRAFEAGADGVYLGLKEFSARKAAANFTLEQLRRIRALAAERGRRIYVTVNTVIREEELGRLSESLAWLEALAVDGVIIQDLGAYELLKRCFPGVPLHASTQMAIHNSAGLREAEAMGFRRVILSRELPLETIGMLRGEHPGIELEVFIHGALCYSFSGACLASWSVAGRSGNRGDCAQICRSLFRDESKKEGGHFFSCRDLFVGREVLALAGLGIDALKIEGRMKSPEYVFNATRLYREILDRGDALPEEEYQELVRRAEIGFSREKTTGYLHSSSGSRLIDTRYPGHRGSALGKVETVRGRDISLRLGADLSVHDGLAYFAPSAGSGPAAEPVIFSVQKMRKGGRELRFARAGETVTVEAPSRETAPQPAVGTEIRHLSSRFLDLPQPKEAGFAMYRMPVDIEVTLEEGESGGLLSARPLRLPARKGFTAGSGSFSRSVTLDRATRKKPFAHVLGSLLGESGDSLFRLGNLSFVNRSGFGDEEIFVPPSELKKVKNDLFAHLDELFLSAVESVVESVGVESLGLPNPGPREGAASAALGKDELRMLAHREFLTPRGSGPVPFAGSDPSALRADILPSLAGFTFLALPPVMLDNTGWTTALERIADAVPGGCLAIGLNNISHFSFVDALASRPGVWFFADIYLYAANTRTLAFLSGRVPRLLFAYSWIEGDEENYNSLARKAIEALPMIRVSPDFRSPLFYSMGCFARHSLNSGSCLDGCPKDFTRELTQGKNRFRVVVRDCVTYLFAKGGEP